MKKLTLLVLLLAQLHALKAQTPLKFRDTTIRGQQTFAIIMGVSKYKYVRPLNYADKDARLFRDFLKSPGGGSLKDDNIYMLLNEDALASTFWTKGFQWLKAKQLQKGDRLFIYFAGHGDAIDEDQYFFLSHDCNPAGDKNNYLVGGAIQLYNLKKKIATETAKGVDVFLVMDACRSNELPGGQDGLNFLNTAITEKKVGDVIMLATGAGQESLEDPSIGGGNGLFTWYLVDGLSGVADADGGKNDGKVTFNEIKSYVEQHVPSVALQRFKKKQEPVFCCTEYSEKVVSNVDDAYLQKWMKDKRRTGNSIESFSEEDYRRFAADTNLVETYNRFYRAIKSNNLTGSSSAEDYFSQLEKKFPGNPYTLDAKTTFAENLINEAQKRVHDCLGCAVPENPKNREPFTRAGNLVEKAISIIRSDDPDYAAELSRVMYLLKASGTYTGTTEAFRFAYAGKSADPNGAYINFALARLHLDNNNTDSALFYAEKTTRLAPKWACALSLLTKLKNPGQKQPDVPGKIKPKTAFTCKPSFGFTLGGGLNQSNPTYSGNQQAGILGVDASSAPSGNLGALYQVCIGNTLSIRPTTTISFESTAVDFQRRSGTGGPIITETVTIKGATVNIALPLIIRLSSNNVAPYLHLGPSFSYMLSQNNESRELLPVKKSMVLGGGGLGVDIGIPKAGIILSPELKYSAGFSDIRDGAATTPNNEALSSLKRNSFSLNLYLRKR